MRDLSNNFPLEKFEKLIIDIGWESLDEWFNFGVIKKIFYQLSSIGITM